LKRQLSQTFGDQDMTPEDPNQSSPQQMIQPQDLPRPRPRYQSVTRQLDTDETMSDDERMVIDESNNDGMYTRQWCRYNLFS
jgi:hypothetical protein